MRLLLLTSHSTCEEVSKCYTTNSKPFRDEHQVRRIAEIAGRELKWSQPSALRMEYELHAGDELAAVLRFPSSFNSHATAESADGCWTFERVGFWRNKTVVRACGKQPPLAVFKNSRWGSGGTLELPGGRRYPATTNFWHTDLEIRNERGESLFQLWSGGILRLSATTIVHPRAARLPEAPWLVMLGCYLLVMMKVDAAAAAV
jgi:hypothetical protein